MSSSERIRFDRPLSGVRLLTGRARLYTEEEHQAACAQARRDGAEEASRHTDQQLVEFRADVQRLQSGVFEKLLARDAELAGELRRALPGLALEIARRLLAGFEPPPELLEKLCREALEELHPERDDLELCLSPRDAELIAQAQPTLTLDYPRLKFTADPALSPGDCLVRSRFGVTDARRETKLRALAEGLAHA